MFGRLKVNMLGGLKVNILDMVDRLRVNVTELCFICQGLSCFQCITTVYSFSVFIPIFMFDDTNKLPFVSFTAHVGGRKVVNVLQSVHVIQPQRTRLSPVPSII